MPSLEEVLAAARAKLDRGEAADAGRIVMMAAKAVADKNLIRRAAELYEQAADIYRGAFKPQQCFEAIENATVMFLRMSGPKMAQEVARISEKGGDMAQAAGEFQKAAEFYFRAGEFADSQTDRERLSEKAVGALLDLAGILEEKGQFDEAIAALKKVSGIYYSTNNADLGKRVNDRGAKLALRWAEMAKRSGDYLAAASAIAEAAQIKQAEGDVQEAPRLMVEAGELYEKVGLYDKAGNMYDAAQESYRKQRLTSAHRTAMTRAAEAYMKMEGKPEVLAPLLVKAGSMFDELGLGVKARWAFKRAADLFKELADRAAASGDNDSQRRYLRHHAMCLRKWGYEKEADEVSNQVISYYIQLAEAAPPESEDRAFALEELGALYLESGRPGESAKYLMMALETYVKAAEKEMNSGEHGDAATLYSRAADVATRLGDSHRSTELHSIASEQAAKAASIYGESGTAELETVWLRTAAIEALSTGKQDMIARAIDFLRRSSSGFRAIKDMRNAFDDLFLVFATLVKNAPERTEEITRTVNEMEELYLTSRDQNMKSVLDVVKPIAKQSAIASLIALHENELNLGQKLEVLRELVDLTRSQKRVQQSG